MTPQITKEDLDTLLKGYQRGINHYRVEEQLRPNEYNRKMLKKIDLMVCEVLARYHNQ